VARPLSDQKREAIVTATIGLVADLGTGAPTANIAKAAGLAEGTLFNYFATKDQLLNALYGEIKADLAEAMLAGYPAQGSLRERIRHVWDRFIDWGAAHPLERKAMRQLSVSERITEDSRRQGNAAFSEINAMLAQGRAGDDRKDPAPAFTGAILEAIADATLEFIARDALRHDQYKQAGFDAFWHGHGG